MVVDSLAVKDFEWNLLFKYLGTTDICVRYFPWNGLNFLDYGENIYFYFVKPIYCCINITTTSKIISYVYADIPWLIFSSWLINVTNYAHIFLYSTSQYVNIWNAHTLLSNPFTTKPFTHYSKLFMIYVTAKIAESKPLQRLCVHLCQNECLWYWTILNHICWLPLQYFMICFII